MICSAFCTCFDLWFSTSIWWSVFIFMSELMGVALETFFRSAERYDPREHQWTKIANMNTKRGCHSLVSLNDKLWVQIPFFSDKKKVQIPFLVFFMLSYQCYETCASFPHYKSWVGLELVGIKQISIYPSITTLYWLHLKDDFEKQVFGELSTYLPMIASLSLMISNRVETIYKILLLWP